MECGVFLGFDFSLGFNNIYTHSFLTFLFLTRVPFDLLFGFTSEFLLGFFKQKLRTQKIKTKNSPFPNHFYEPLSAFNCLGVAQNNHCETTATICDDNSTHIATTATTTVPAISKQRHQHMCCQEAPNLKLETKNDSLSLSQMLKKNNNDHNESNKFFVHSLSLFYAPHYLINIILLSLS